METITVKIANKKKAAQFVAFIKGLNYVKSVHLTNNSEDHPLTDEDWVRPGRPATDEEWDARISEYETDDGGFTSEEVRFRVNEELAKYRASLQLVESL